MGQRASNTKADDVVPGAHTVPVAVCGAKILCRIGPRPPAVNAKATTTCFNPRRAIYRRPVVVVMPAVL